MRLENSRRFTNSVSKFRDEISKTSRIFETKLQGVSRNGATLKLLDLLMGISIFDTDFFQDYRIRHELSESAKIFGQKLCQIRIAHAWFYNPEKNPYQKCLFPSKFEAFLKWLRNSDTPCKKSKKMDFYEKKFFRCNCKKITRLNSGLLFLLFLKQFAFFRTCLLFFRDEKKAKVT